MELTWNECVYLKGKDDMVEYFAERKNQLFILGKGFDPRTCEGISIFHSLNKQIDVLIINYSEKGNGNSARNERLGEDNFQKIKGIISEDNIFEKKVTAWGNQDESIRKNIQKD